LQGRPNTHSPFTNRLLASTSADQQADIERVAQVIEHKRGDEMYREGQVIDELIFPIEGLISLTIDTSDGQTVEVAIIGSEGMVGVSRYLGNLTADSNAVMQVAGWAAHIKAEEVIRWASEPGPLRRAIDTFLRSLLVEISQSAVCNQLHSVEQRTSRWLLHASDRAGTTNLSLTHEFLAQMLAVRRSSVTTVVGIFTRAGLTSTQRGLISIADREGLRAFACECYDIVRAATPASPETGDGRLSAGQVAVGADG
jgi:CRP-like cAMP-binding protein